jgi:hypothetical protein
MSPSNINNSFGDDKSGNTIENGSGLLERTVDKRKPNSITSNNNINSNKASFINQIITNQ